MPAVQLALTVDCCSTAFIIIHIISVINNKAGSAAEVAAARKSAKYTYGDESYTIAWDIWLRVHEKSGSLALCPVWQ